MKIKRVDEDGVEHGVQYDNYSGTRYGMASIPDLSQTVFWRNPEVRIRAYTNRASVTDETWIKWEPYIFWFTEERSNSYNWDSVFRDKYIPTAEEAYIKIYLRFVHKDDKTIYYETVRTFKMNINRHACTLRKHNIEVGDPNPPPVCSET